MTVEMTKTNHGSVVPMPRTVFWDGLWKEKACPRCGLVGAISYKEIDDIHEDYRYRCERSLNGCNHSWIVEGPDS